jgi:hypothetical protein
LLEHGCRNIDIESLKGSIDGSQVSRVYRAGRIDDIGEYCLRDVRATAQLYQKLAGTMLPLFQGDDGSPLDSLVRRDFSASASAGTLLGPELRGGRVPTARGLGARDPWT